MRGTRKFAAVLTAAVSLLVGVNIAGATPLRPVEAVAGLSPVQAEVYVGVGIGGGYGGYGGYRPYGAYRPYGVYRPYGAYRPYPRYYGGIYGGVGPYWGPGVNVVVPAYPAYRPLYRPVYPSTRPVYPAVRAGSAHVSWCAARYRSYRAWDDTFQPYNGPRRPCLSPYR